MAVVLLEIEFLLFFSGFKLSSSYKLFNIPAYDFLHYSIIFYY